MLWRRARALPLPAQHQAEAVGRSPPVPRAPRAGEALLAVAAVVVEPAVLLVVDRRLHRASQNALDSCPLHGMAFRSRIPAGVRRFEGLCRPRSKLTTERSGNRARASPPIGTATFTSLPPPPPPTHTHDRMVKDEPVTVPGTRTGTPGSTDTALRYPAGVRPGYRVDLPVLQDRLPSENPPPGQVRLVPGMADEALDDFAGPRDTQLFCPYPRRWPPPCPPAPRPHPSQARHLSLWDT